ncbi:RNA 2',3'-cyclic phosphodiesterase [Pseudomonas sp. BIGb0427]|uniref:RNA 2',3'-cyclic phosphodiesterase n=1 Tax=unclassified Pseudomonas TaxID=196821 RepID=UPI0016B7270C|nr:MULTISPECIES: RNA 2',3'-cyclic phosphodiesterase [unclassified Pseudomonas]NLU60138.1 RNA 2',3'-cyclic phosphodiesterase [Pseudomonas sp. BIGb0427]QPG61399.1 RNA 2',3'-cyclic phosphodiesterase [Pseudomonas sp. BIGb0427]UVM68916.1 RNA 2',3'-cyclic phosphodiesterase [Pseudomonas sp. B21-009]
MDPGNGDTGEPFKRLFFALDCAPQQRRAIARWRSELELKSARPVPSANFHLTLMFVGAAGTAQLPAILAGAAGVKVAGEPLTVVLDRLQVWRPAKALVLVPSQTPAALRQLAYALQQAMLALGFTEDPRDYRPHLTLARDYRGSEPEALVPAEFILHARHFSLFESRKGQYWPLAQWPL